jgi:hypothetical protein
VSNFAPRIGNPLLPVPEITLFARWDGTPCDRSRGDWASTATPAWTAGSWGAGPGHRRRAGRRGGPAAHGPGPGDGRFPATRSIGLGDAVSDRRPNDVAHSLALDLAVVHEQVTSGAPGPARDGIVSYRGGRCAMEVAG